MLRSMLIATIMVASATTVTFASPTDERYYPSAGLTGNHQTIPTSHRYRHRYRVSQHVRSPRTGRHQRGQKRAPAVRQWVEPVNAWVAFSAPDDRALATPQASADATGHTRRRHRITGVADAPRGPRPRAWCGWWLSRHLGISDRRLWLARNWAGVGQSAGGPRVGAVVVWRHHVGIITGQAGGKWVVKSGNDGRAVRERPRSIAGAIAFRML
jgi:hypothetical protein